MTTIEYADHVCAVPPTAPTGHVTVVLIDGGVVVLRPLQRGEADPQLAVLEGMSAFSRWQRFLTSMPPRLPAAAMAALSDIDGRRHVAWLASIDGAPAGIARYVELEPGVAEVAFEVVDAHHGRGVGSVLLESVVTVAAANGIGRLSASVHPSNASSVRLLRRVGLSLELVDGLLEGCADLVLPAIARVDRVQVLTVALCEPTQPKARLT